MKKIFADMCRDDWYSVFVDLAELGVYKECCHFGISSEETESDIIILDSFDNLLAFEDIFGRDQSFEFIIVTGDSEKEELNTTVVGSANLYICDRRIAARLIMCLWGRQDLNKESLSADLPRFVMDFESKMNFFLDDKIMPVFDNDH